MLTHNYDYFPSDVFVVMAAVGATLSIGEWRKKCNTRPLVYVTYSLYSHLVQYTVSVTVGFPHSGHEQIGTLSVF